MTKSRRGRVAVAASGGVCGYTSTQARVFAITYCTYVLMYFTRKPLSVVKARLEEDVLAGEDATRILGNIDTAFLIAYAIGQFTIGRLGDRLGARPLLAIGCVGSALCSLVFGRATDYRVFTAAWAVNGVFQAGMFPLSLKAIAPYFASRQRGSVIGVWTTAQQLGSILATSFAAYILLIGDWRLVFTLPALPVLAAGALTYLMLGDEQAAADAGADAVPLLDADAAAAADDDGDGDEATPPRRLTRASAAATKKRTSRERRELRATAAAAAAAAAPKAKVPKSGDEAAVPSFADVARIHGIANLGAAYFCVKLVRYTLLFWLPYYLHKQLGYTQPMAGFVATVFDIGGAPGSVVAGVVADRLAAGRRTLVVFPMCLGCGLLVLGYSQLAGAGLLVNGAAMGAVGLLVAGPDSMLGGAATQDYCERSRWGMRAVGTAAGIVNGMGSVGAIMQGPLTAYISATYGWPALFQALGALCCFAALALLPLWAEERRPR